MARFSSRVPITCDEDAAKARVAVRMSLHRHGDRPIISAAIFYCFTVKLKDCRSLAEKGLGE
jgi:hypothetical protein